jgi:ribosomal protein S18 acetylase RimI-like enzyme
MTAAFTLRQATAADAEALARGAVEGVADYPAFAPSGWTGPAYDTELEYTRVVLADPDYHCVVAEIGGGVVGQVTVVPAAKAARAVDDTSLGHLRNLYVHRSQWGSGLATALMRAALEDARARGFAELRLFVAEEQARARRFYEREGWVTAGPEFMLEDFGLDVVEYRRELGG